jgi:uridine kinase
MNEALTAKAVARVRQVMRAASGPCVVALDGRSGVGKSTLAGTIAGRLHATVIEGDDFYAGGVGILGDPVQARAARCIDWRDQARVLTLLRKGRSARYHAFDWDTFDGQRLKKATVVDPAPVILLEGVYAARPELAGFLDLRILMQAPDALRIARLLAREGEIGPWETQWHEAEEWYFTHAAPAKGFDLVLEA